MKNFKFIFATAVGIINSALGAGGGMISVPAMKKYGLNQKQAQATTISVILPLTVISVIIYIFNSEFSVTDAVKYIPFGVAGSVIGVLFMEKIKGNLLKKIFAVFMLWAGIRMILR